MLPAVELDRDGSGQVDVAELIDMLEGVQRSRKERRYMCYGMIAMLVFGVVLIGTIIGLTYAMLYSLKDTEVKGGVMFVKNSDGATNEVVRTGSAEFSVMDGAMVQRVTTDSAANNAMGNVLRTADYMGTPQTLNSEIDIKELLELKYLLINGSSNAQLGLVVHGVARVPQEGSIHGTVLHIVTTAGTITLDGTIIAFSTTIANIFAEAGFRVSSTRRALLGSYAIMGFFNTIKARIVPCRNLSAAGKPPNEPEPKLPSENFVMKLKGIGSHETTISYGGKIRVMYDFAIYPMWQKIEVMPGSTVYSWQENVLPAEGNSTNEVAQYFCGDSPAASKSAGGVDPSSVLNYTYLGVDSVGETLARHFELNVLQQSDNNGTTEVMRIDYWDALTTYTPLRFEFTHKDIGSIAIDVVEFRSIDASSPEANPVMFDVPALHPNFTCPNDPSLPRLSTPFMVRGAVVPADMPAGEYDAGGADPDTSRRLITQSFALAQQWDKLDHVNGTGDWPQWALDMYGGVHPARREESKAVRRTGIALSVEGSVCLGYNYKDKIYFLEASLAVKVPVFKVTLTIEIDFSSCCIWIAVVNLEATAAISFLSIEITLGDIGFWGDWQKASYPCGKFMYSKDRGMELYALPINSYQLRIEKQTTASDDTALNGISVGCMSGTSNTVEGNNGNDRGNGVYVHNGWWGDWTPYTFCPGQTYICGLQTRVESVEATDDTAMNGLRIACCNFPTNTDTSVISAGSIKTRNSASSSTCLDVLCNRTPAQIFSLNLPTRANTGSVEALAGQNDRCLDVSGNRQTPGTYIQVGAQEFTITAAGTNAYQLKSSGGFCMTVQNAGAFSGARIIIDRCVNGASNQLFKASAGYQGGVSLSPFHATNLCLDVSNGSTNNGAIVQLWNCNGSKPQSWKVILPVS
ncbi:hypothetical protein GPECTOR_27g653 [Gonium pectorale]|uniref:EF-hand domain-containing protein n=1 Tax=Gonium pectorale TaxID=33097 RepID=A0A150GFC4_GONPE|nr:hypothetical protein GPECTOR_27g653 [Gonium pectorale]|eukprot:KXZ48483.1 hypothetical protein GPECTOR_27g653 [Gonium pectorale]